MAETKFVFDLEKGEEGRESGTNYAVRYYIADNKPFVEIGDGYRHQLVLEAKYWNRLINIILCEELGKSDLEAVLKLMSHALPEEYEATLISAINAGIITNFG